MTDITPQLRRLLEIRTGIAQNKSIMDQIVTNAQAEPDYINAATEVASLLNEMKPLEDEIRAAALKAYKADKTKLPGTSVGGTTTTRVVYDIIKALDWAKDKHPEFLTLDTSGFDAYAVGVMGTPAEIKWVTVETSVERKVSIARDLAKVLGIKPEEGA